MERVLNIENIKKLDYTNSTRFKSFHIKTDDIPYKIGELHFFCFQSCSDNAKSEIVLKKN